MTPLFNDRSLVSRIIVLSKKILILKINKIQLIRAKSVALRSEINLFTIGYYSEMVDELESKIKELNHQIESLMKPLFQDKKFKQYKDKEEWALSQYDMHRGYLDLEEDSEKSISYILFLSDYKDRIHDIKEGSLHLKEKVSQILSNQKNVFGNFQSVNKFLYTSILIENNKYNDINKNDTKR